MALALCKFCPKDRTTKVKRIQEFPQASVIGMLASTLSEPRLHCLIGAFALEVVLPLSLSGPPRVEADYCRSSLSISTFDLQIEAARNSAGGAIAGDALATASALNKRPAQGLDLGF